jgi:hypothetical protein
MCVGVFSLSGIIKVVLNWGANVQVLVPGAGGMGCVLINCPLVNCVWLSILMIVSNDLCTVDYTCSLLFLGRKGVKFPFVVCIIPNHFDDTFCNASFALKSRNCPLILT